MTNTNTNTTPLAGVPAGVHTVASMFENGWIACWGDLYAAIDAGHAVILPEPGAGIYGSGFGKVVRVRVFF
jgi:hypothetical protein